MQFECLAYLFIKAFTKCEKISYYHRTKMIAKIMLTLNRLCNKLGTYLALKILDN